MRIYADLNRIGDSAPESESVIIQVAPKPPVGSATPINGKFVVPVPDGIALPEITVSSRLLGSGGVVESLYSAWLAANRSFDFVHYNALLTSTDHARLDVDGRFVSEMGPPPRIWNTRAQFGRAGAMSQNGLAPGSVTVLAANTTVLPARPGLLVTEPFDISAQRPQGADRFLVYWKWYSVTRTHDVMNYATEANTPALRQLVEVAEAPSSTAVYLSADGGAGYVAVRPGVPCTACTPGTLLRLAFVNHSATPYYLAAYAVLY
jgi:hypothetical protein